MSDCSFSAACRASRSLPGEIPFINPKEGVWCSIIMRKFVTILASIVCGSMIVVAVVATSYGAVEYVRAHPLVVCLPGSIVTLVILIGILGSFQENRLAAARRKYSGAPERCPHKQLKFTPAGYGCCHFHHQVVQSVWKEPRTRDAEEINLWEALSVTNSDVSSWMKPVTSFPE
jgi:hypothetical protein